MSTQSQALSILRSTMSGPRPLGARKHIKWTSMANERYFEKEGNTDRMSREQQTPLFRYPVGLEVSSKQRIHARNAALNKIALLEWWPKNPNLTFEEIMTMIPSLAVAPPRTASGASSMPPASVAALSAPINGFSMALAKFDSLWQNIPAPAGT